MILKLFLILLIIQIKLSSFIIQADKLEKNSKIIVLFSDIHLPELPNSKIKQKNQNKTLKNYLKKAKNLTVLFEGYKQDQKNKFTKQQIKRSKHLTTPAYFDILTQTLKNKEIKLIPSDPRKNINTAFINCVKTFELLSNEPYEKVLQGYAKIKRLNQQEKLYLQQLEKTCPSFNQIFKNTNVTNYFDHITNKTIVEIISDILLNHYTILEKPYKDKLKIIMNNLITIFEKSFKLFDNKLFSKIKKSKHKKILVFAGQDHIQNLKTRLLTNDYKIKEKIFDSNTINLLNNLYKQIENVSLKNLEIQLEEKADSLKLPTKAFNLIV